MVQGYIKPPPRQVDAAEAGPISQETLDKYLPDQTQVGGSHYKQMDPQPWNVTIPWVDQGHIGHPEATAIEYIARWRSKNGVQDLRKAIHWLEKRIYIEEVRQKEANDKRTEVSNEEETNHPV